MFPINKDRLTNILIDCYRKVKSFSYYSNNLDLLKLKCSSFENDKKQMNTKIDILCDAIINKNHSYFDALFKSIKTYPQIKGYLETIKNDDDIFVTNCEEENLAVSKVNFFIDADIEIYILDAFWGCLIGSITSQDSILKYSYGNSLAKHFDKKCDDLIDEIDFKTLSFYKPYFKQYTSWKDNAIKEVEKLLNEGHSSTIISIDLTRYYYFADIDFNELYEFLMNLNKQFANFYFIHMIEENIYKNYTNQLQKYLKDINKDSLCIPIGLLSSGLIANINLLKTDCQIAEKVNFYGRYVDDILIVTNQINIKSLKEFVQKVGLEDTFKLTEDGMIIKDKPSLKIQISKTKIIEFKKDGPKSLLKKIKNELFLASESRLFPDPTIDIDNFTTNIFENKNSLKPSETENLKIDAKKLVTAIYSILFLRKGIEEIDSDDCQIDKYLNEIVKIFSDSLILRLTSRWTKIILLFTLLSDEKTKKYCKEFKDKTNKVIKNLKCEFEDYYKNKQSLSSLLKTSLRNQKNISIAMADAIVGGTNISNRAKMLRRANLIDNFVINIPLINYTNAADSNLNYFTCNHHKFLEGQFELDNFKIKFSPIYIHLSYFSLFYFLKNYYDTRNPKQLVNMVQEYKNYIAPIFGDFYDCFDFTENKKNNYINRLNVAVCKSGKVLDRNLYIGIANINMKSLQITEKKNPERLNTKIVKPLVNKRCLIRLLNDSYLKEGGFYYSFDKKTKSGFLDYLIFPEAYLPIEWLPLIERFARKTMTKVITGLRYCVVNKIAYNFQAVVIPYFDKVGHKECLVAIREKNNYAPFEKAILRNSKLKSNDAENSFYYNFTTNDGVTFAPFICYELTDIIARSIFKNMLDILFVSEYNQDIAYFANIVDSSARDLYAFTVQCNASEFGDSKIIGPYRRDYKIITQITGGEKNLIHIGKINVLEKNNYLDEFKICDKKRDYKALEKNKDYNKFKKPSANYKNDLNDKK